MPPSTPDSDPHRKADTLKQALADARKELEERDARLAMIAHELKNPLAAITFALDPLKSAQTPPQKKEELLAIVTRQTALMSRILEDIKSIRLTTDVALPLELTVHDLNRSIDDVIEAVSPTIAEKAQLLTVELADQSLMLRGDLIKLKQAMINLLHNASKYTPQEGTIELATRQVGDTVEFSVQDSGIGFEPEDRPYLFQLFRQRGRGDSQSVEGVGFGLFWVARIVMAHGGTVEAESEGKNRGSRFSFRLPAERDRPLKKT